MELSKEESESIDWFKFDIYSLGITLARAAC